MKRIVYTSAFLLLLLVLSQCIRNSPGTPGGLNYYAFADKTKTSLLKAGDVTAQRVSLTDSTKVIKSQRLFFPGPLALFDNRVYQSMFQIAQGDSLLVKGLNKIRLTYSGKSNVDWLQFYNRQSEWIDPEQVRFNGRVIERHEVNEPTPPSYLYVLE